MSFPKNILTLSILAIASSATFAEEQAKVQQLATIEIKAHPLERNAADFAVADHVIEQKDLAEKIDVTLPVRPQSAGTIHPVSQVWEEVVQIFGDLGFAVAEGPHRAWPIPARIDAIPLTTGRVLFVGDAARPDLAVEAVTGAEGLFHSLRRLTELGDGVEVYPGHVAGSLCGAAMSSKASTTIGFERRFNPALALARVPVA